MRRKGVIVQPRAGQLLRESRGAEISFHRARAHGLHFGRAVAHVDVVRAEHALVDGAVLPLDVVAVEDNAMGVYRYRTQTPIVLTEHEVRRPRPFDWRSILQTRDVGRLIAELDWQRWRSYQKRVWEAGDRIQVFTPRDAHAIQEVAPELAGRLRVNPFGIDLPARSKFEREDGESLRFVGNYTHQPNVDAAVWLGREIMPQIWARSPGARLTLVGIYPPQPVQALACKRIEVTGAVPELEPYLERCSVVLAPVRIGGGMRMKVLQAMAHGKAVITTRRGADGLRAEGCRPPLVIAEQPEAIASEVEVLLHHPEERRELGDRARAYVEKHYSAQAYTRRLEAVYSEVCC